VKEWLAWWIYRWNAPPADVILPISELIDDPEERLSREAVEVPRVRLLRPSVALLLLATCGIWLIFSAWNKGRLSQPKEIGVLIVMACLLLWGSIALFAVRRLRMTLTRDGVTIADGKGTIVCPWNLFNTDGSWTTEVVPHRIHFAVNVDEIPHVIMTRPDGSTVEGEAVANHFFRFGKHGSVHLSAFFAVSPEELVHVLLWTGRTLERLPGESDKRGREQPRAPSFSQSHSPHTFDEPAKSTPRFPNRGDATVDSRGWLTVSIVHWQPPHICCLCGEETEETRPVLAVSRYLGYFHGGIHYETVVCCCPSCQKSFRNRDWAGRITILLITLLIPALGLMALFGPGEFFALMAKHPSSMLIFWGALTIILLKMLGRFGPELFSPVRARYKARDEKVAFRFSRPGYAQLALEWIEGS